MLTDAIVALLFGDNPIITLSLSFLAPADSFLPNMVSFYFHVFFWTQWDELGLLIWVWVRGHLPKLRTPISSYPTEQSDTPYSQNHLPAPQGVVELYNPLPHPGWSVEGLVQDSYFYPQLLYVHNCNGHIIARKQCFLTRLPILWFLHPFCHDVPEAFWSRTLNSHYFSAPLASYKSFH